MSERKETIVRITVFDDTGIENTQHYRTYCKNPKDTVTIANIILNETDRFAHVPIIINSKKLFKHIKSVMSDFCDTHPYRYVIMPSICTYAILLKRQHSIDKCFRIESLASKILKDNNEPLFEPIIWTKDDFVPDETHLIFNFKKEQTKYIPITA